MFFSAAATPQNTGLLLSASKGSSSVFNDRAKMASMFTFKPSNNRFDLDVHHDRLKCVASGIDTQSPSPPVPELPYDIWLNILPLLQLHDVLKIFALNKEFSKLSNDSCLWKLLVTKWIEVEKREEKELLDAEIRTNYSGSWKLFWRAICTNVLVDNDSGTFTEITSNSAVQIKEGTSTFITRTGFAVGKYFWEARLGPSRDGNTMIGIIVLPQFQHADHKGDYCSVKITPDKDKLVSNFNGKNIKLCHKSIGYMKSTWGYCQGSGDKWTNSMGVKYGDPATMGDVIGVLVESDGIKASVSYFKNGQCMGKAFDNINATNHRIFPTFSMYNRGDSLDYYPRSKLPFIPSPPSLQQTSTCNAPPAASMPPQRK